MAVLLIAEHNNVCIASGTAHAATAALQCGGEVHVLVAGRNCGKVADAAAHLIGISMVHWADAPALRLHPPELIAWLVLELLPGYAHVVAPAGPLGRAVLSHVADSLQVQCIADVTRVVTGSAFECVTGRWHDYPAESTASVVKLLTAVPAAFPPVGCSVPAMVRPMTVVDKLPSETGAALPTKKQKYAHLYKKYLYVA